MKKIILLILIFVIANSLLGCASMNELRRGMNAIDSFWGETNKKYLNKYGERTYTIDIGTSVSAMNAVMTAFNINIVNEYRSSNKEIIIKYKGTSSSVLSKDEFQKVKKVEEPMMQSIAATEVGNFTSNFFLLTNGDDFNIVIKVNFKEVNFNTRIYFDFEMHPKKEDTYDLYGDNPPPESVKIALDKAWSAFEGQVKKITGVKVTQLAK